MSPSPAADLRRGYREHRPYLAVAAALYLAGAVAGVGAHVAGVDLFAVLGGGSLAEELPADRSVGRLFATNTQVFLVLVAGGLTLGLFTLFGLVVNGLVLGHVAALAAVQRGPAVAAAGLVPHGVLEVPALLLGAAVSLRIVVRLLSRLRGTRDAVLGRDGWRRVGALLVVAWAGLLVAAVVEAHVTATLVTALG